jgi:hypothetical protein
MHPNARPRWQGDCSACPRRCELGSAAENMRVAGALGGARNSSRPRRNFGRPTGSNRGREGGSVIWRLRETGEANLRILRVLRNLTPPHPQRHQLTHS